MADKLEREMEEMIEKATERFGQALRELIRWSYEESDEAPTVAEIEEKIREWIGKIGEDSQSMVLGQMDQRRRKGKRACPRCGERVYWTRYEARRYVTSLGTLRIERAYYHHGACHCGWVPLDERLKLGDSELSPFVQEMVSYLGGFMPFERVSKYLQRFMGIEISHDTVNETTVQVGERLREEQEAAVQRAWAEGEVPTHAIEAAPKQLYVSADGINHRLPNGQGKELKVAAIYETEKRPNCAEEEIHARDIEYVVASEAEALARAAYVRAVPRGLQKAQERVVLGDGAQWIWNRVASALKVPDCIEILDFYHATAYVWRAGECAFGEGTKQAKSWAQQACHALKHEGPLPVLKKLRALPVPKSVSAEPINNALNYIQKRTHRMDYPSYRKKGLQIGSGSAESGVLQVVGARINQPGMRWNGARAESVAHVRAAILSDRWDRHWASHQPTPRRYRRPSTRPVA